MRWLIAFAITQAIEAPLYWMASPRLAKEPLSPGERLFASLGPSALTHPIVWFVVPWLLPGAGVLGRLVVAETFAVVAEALVFRAMRLRRPFALSLVANAISASIGMALARADLF